MKKIARMEQRKGKKAERISIFKIRVPAKKASIARKHTFGLKMVRYSLII